MQIIFRFTGGISHHQRQCSRYVFLTQQEKVNEISRKGSREVSRVECREQFLGSQLSQQSFKWKRKEEFKQNSHIMSVSLNCVVVAEGDGLADLFVVGEETKAGEWGRRGATSKGKALFHSCELARPTQQVLSSAASLGRRLYASIQ